MTRTYSTNGKIYSVDMMIAYVSIFKPEYKKVDLKDFINVIDYKGWGDPITKKMYSPSDVINNKRNYKKEYERIKSANLNYPIIISNDQIIDGVHRYIKAYMSGKKTIKAYVFPQNLMNKFIINRNGNWKIVDSMEISDYIKLFYKRFIK